MVRLSIVGSLVALTGFLLTSPVTAESMRCQSVNGNVNCSGSGAVSCQTINGQRTCVSGGGAVMQSFGGRQNWDYDTQDEDDDEGPQEAWPGYR
ncbi:MAG: hypothetical protein AB7F35_23555 [Acetobacteraceae bacterium]